MNRWSYSFLNRGAVLLLVALVGHCAVIDGDVHSDITCVVDDVEPSLVMRNVTVARNVCVQLVMNATSSRAEVLIQNSIWSPGSMLIVSGRGMMTIDLLETQFMDASVVLHHLTASSTSRITFGSIMLNKSSPINQTMLPKNLLVPAFKLLTTYNSKLSPMNVVVGLVLASVSLTGASFIISGSIIVATTSSDTSTVPIALLSMGTIDLRDKGAMAVSASQFWANASQRGSVSGFVAALSWLQLANKVCLIVVGNSFRLCSCYIEARIDIHSCHC